MRRREGEEGGEGDGEREGGKWSREGKGGGGKGVKERKGKVVARLSSLPQPPICSLAKTPGLGR